MILFSSLFYLIIVLLLAHFQVLDFSLPKYGLPGWAIIGVLLLMLLGGLVDIPLAIRGRGKKSQKKSLIHSLLNSKKQARKGLYINLGGLIVPVIFSLYLFTRAPLVPTLIALCVMTILAKFFSWVSPHKGNWIRLPAFVPLLAALSLALILSPANPAIVFYIAGILGTLIGAGLLNIDKIKQAPLFIGGRGMFHGLFIVGVVFLLL